jgi:DNA-binding LacI/PurR family transcriptional regulator/DNA-binding transcriptional regulator YhcF (GntR family)
MKRRTSIDKGAAIRESPRAKAFRWIDNAIANGDLRPGDELPAERELSAKLRVSRHSLAAAIADAERQGMLVRLKPTARKRFVSGARPKSIAASSIHVLNRLERFVDGRPVPRWSDPFITSELIWRLSAEGWHVVSLNEDRLDQEELDRMFRNPPPGMIVIGSVNSRPLAARALELCRNASVPVVAYGNGPALRTFDRVFSDHRAGARDLTRWLLEKGRRRIVPFFPVEDDAYWVGERLAGYAEAMREAKKKPFPCVYFGARGAMDLQVEERFRIFTALAMEKLAELRGAGGVDALMCLNDSWARCAIAAISKMGLDPSRDILVTGYDNIGRECLFAEFEPRNPSVTIDKHNEKTAEEMATLLLARMDGKLPPEPQVRCHPHELVVL